MPGNIDLVESFDQFKEFKNIDRPTMMRVLDDVFKTLLRKKYGTDENFDIIVNTEKGDLEIWRKREIVPDADLRDLNRQIPYSSAIKIEDDFEVGDKVALNVAYQKAGGNERMIPSEFKFRVVGVREVPKGGGGTYQDVSVERMSDGERVGYADSQLARIEDQEMFGEMEGEVQNEEKEEK